tara:strand:- start:147 stop:923 length:777 start_codon:yes stop_codon:yes gene_type:complete
MLHTNKDPNPNWHIVRDGIQGVKIPTKRILNANNTWGSNEPFETVSRAHGEIIRAPIAYNTKYLIHQSQSNPRHKVGNLIHANGKTWHSSWPHWLWNLSNLSKSTYITQLPEKFINDLNKYDATLFHNWSVLNGCTNGENCYPTIVFPNGMYSEVSEIAKETNPGTGKTYTVYKTKLIPKSHVINDPSRVRVSSRKSPNPKKPSNSKSSSNYNNSYNNYKSNNSFNPTPNSKRRKSDIILQSSIPKPSYNLNGFWGVD